jgi:hypothetical protein
MFGVWRSTFRGCDLAQRDLLIGVARAVQSEEFAIRDRSPRRRPRNSWRVYGSTFTRPHDRRTASCQTANLSRPFRGRERLRGRVRSRTPNAERQTLSLHSCRENGLEIRALCLSGYDANIGLDKLCFLQKAQQFHFAEPQPNIGVKVFSLLKAMSEQIED